MHSEDQKQIFNKYRSLDFLKKPYQEKAYLWAKNLRQVKPKILELGAADGSFLSFLAHELNGSPAGLDLAANDSGLVKTHDFQDKLPFPDNSFDLVVSLEVIEHLYDTDYFLSEIRRVLKPHGVLILSTPNLASLPNRLKLLFGKYPKYLDYSRQGAGHIHLYTHQILKKQFTSNSFKLIRLSSINPVNPFITRIAFPHLLRRLFFFLGDLFPSTGSHLLVLAQK